MKAMVAMSVLIALGFLIWTCPRSGSVPSNGLRAAVHRRTDSAHAAAWKSWAGRIRSKEIASAQQAKQFLQAASPKVAHTGVAPQDAELHRLVGDKWDPDRWAAAGDTLAAEFSQ